MIAIILLLTLGLAFFRITPAVFSKERTILLRALLPFAIIVNHLDAHISLVDYPLLNNGLMGVSKIAVMLFFFISGYGLTSKHALQGVRLTSLPLRLLHLFTPCVFPILIYIAVLLLTRQNVGACLQHDLAYCFLPLPFSWFVVSLASLYVAFYCCAFLFPYGSKFLVSLLLGVGLTIAIFSLLGAHGYTYSSNILFFVGAIFYRFEASLLSFLRRNGAFYSLLLLSWAIAIFFYSKSGVVLWSGLFTLLVVLLFSKLCVRNNWVTYFLSRISYSVYLCHGIVFLLIPFEKLGVTTSYGAVFASSIVTATVSYYVHSLVFRRK